MTSARTIGVPIRQALANRTPRSHELYESARQVVPNGTTSGARVMEPYPFFANSGKGGHIFDEDGNDYVDCRLGYGPMLIGHAHPRVVQAVAKALDDGFIFGAPHRSEAQLARRISEVSACAERVNFCSSGTEATLHALRIARAATGRDKIAKFEGGYHGSHDGVALNIHALGGDDVLHLQPMPETLGIPSAAAALSVILPYNDPSAFAIIERESASLAAVIVEPMLGVGGALPAAPGFLAQLRELTHRLGIVLIFDEVITGFRLALGGAQETTGIVPDLVTYGKPIGGGFPIGVVAGSRKYMDLLESTGDGVRNRTERVMFGGTSNGHPITMVAGIATLDVLEEQNPEGYRRLTSWGDHLRTELNDFAAREGIAFHVTGSGPVFASHFLENLPTNPRELAAEDKGKQKELGIALLYHGVFLNPTHAFLSFAHTDEDLDRIISAHRAALRYVVSPS